MIKINNISKTFFNHTGFSKTVLKNISLEIEEKSTTSIIAPGKSGKSTLLKIISGLINSDTNEKVSNKKIIYIPSTATSFPWLNVKENIFFELQSIDNNSLQNILNLIGLDGYESHYPKNNSYGFRFRIALARSIIRRPDLICIDDSFKEMDVQTRLEIYSLIKEIKRKTEVSFLIATSDINESILLSDKIYLMKKNPGEIFKSFFIDEPFIQDNELINSQKFIQLKSTIENEYRAQGLQHYLQI